MLTREREIRYMRESERESRQYSSNVFICHIRMYIEYRYTYTGMNERIREREK